MHTPTPWKAMIRGDGQTTHSVYVDIPNGHGIIADEIRSPENAAFIVQACNAYDALAAALTEAIGLIRIWHGIQNGEEAWNIYAAHSPEMKRLNAALTLATPQEAVR